MRNEKGVRRAVDMIGLLTRAPRTVAELVALTSMGEELVRRWLQALQDEGLVVRAGTRDVRSPVAARIYVVDQFVWRRVPE